MTTHHPSTRQRGGRPLRRPHQVATGDDGRDRRGRRHGQLACGCSQGNARTDNGNKHPRPICVTLSRLSVREVPRSSPFTLHGDHAIVDELDRCASTLRPAALCSSLRTSAYSCSTISSMSEWPDAHSSEHLRLAFEPMGEERIEERLRCRSPARRAWATRHVVARLHLAKRVDVGRACRRRAVTRPSCSSP